MENEAKERRVITDKFNFVSDQILPGQFVHLGYIEDSNDISGKTIKYGAKTQKYVNKDNDEKLGSFIDSGVNPKLGSTLSNFRSTEKYKAALDGTAKTTPLDLAGGRIVKIGKYSINWRDDKSLAKDFELANNQEREIRKKHGFGNDDSTYPENDWHRKYGGTGILRQVDPRYTNNGTKYTNYVGSGFWSHIDDQDKLVARQNLASNASNLQHSTWFFVTSDGEMEQLDKELTKHLIHAYGKPAIEKAVEEISDEEKAFKSEIDNLNLYRALVNKQFSYDNILYIVCSVQHPDGSREPITWINMEVFEKFNYIDKQELSQIIQKETKAIVIQDKEETNEGYVQMTQEKFVELVESLVKKRVAELKG